MLTRTKGGGGGGEFENMFLVKIASKVDYARTLDQSLSIVS